MMILKPLYTISIFLLLSLTGLSQQVTPNINNIIKRITTDSYRIHFDSLRTNQGCTRKVIEADIQSSDHDACRDYIFRTLKKYLGEENVYLHQFEIGKNGGLVNIVAFKEGKSLSGRILIVSAHYDSNNSKEVGTSEPICSPGANDNGTGLAAILEIARALSDIETENSILFAAWDFEEQFPFGFAGGSDSWYSDHVIKKKNLNWGDVKTGGKIKIDNLIANVNFDMFGNPGDTVNGKPVLWACSGNEIHSGFIKDYISVFERYIPEIVVVDHGKMTYSDHYTFAARKIPSVENLESGYDDDPFYHTCFDNLENTDNINFDFAVDVTRGGMAFVLEKSGIFFPSVKRIVADLLPVQVSELPGAYILKLPDDDFSVIVINQFGNYINTFKQGDFLTFYTPVSGLYQFFIFNSEERASRNIFLKKKEGQITSFF
jgi:hypothetical protein